MRSYSLEKEVSHSELMEGEWKRQIKRTALLRQKMNTLVYMQSE